VNYQLLDLKLTSSSFFQSSPFLYQQPYQQPYQQATMDGYDGYDVGVPIGRVTYESIPMGTVSTNPQLCNEAINRALQFIHDSRMGVIPDPALRARSLAGTPVVQIFIPGACFKRMAAVSVVLAHAQINDQLSQGGPHLELAGYSIVQYGSSYMILIERPTMRFLEKICKMLMKKDDSLYGSTVPFLVSPSVHRKLVSFDTWRQLHMGETVGNILLDSHAVYSLFLASPMLGVTPVPLYNYFAGIRVAARLF
jgi:hypothetical protein